MVMKYRTYPERAKIVFDRLIAHMNAGEYPFNHSIVPQIRENMPENLPEGGREHALYLWATCYYMRGGIDSVVAFQRLTLIYERKPYLFNPEWFEEQFGNEPFVTQQWKYGKELKRKLAEHVAYVELRTELNAHGLGFSLEENTRMWVLNAIKLKRFWKCDPRIIFAKAKTYEDLIRMIANVEGFSLHSENGFLGFQHKMVSMIAYFLGDAKLIDLSVIPVPVDFHVLRMLVSNGIIRPGWRAGGDSIFSQELLRVARDITEDYCKKEGRDMIELCNSLWLFSRAMCSWHPDNNSETPDKSKKRKEQQKLRHKRKVEISQGSNANLEDDPLKPNPGLGRRSRVVHRKPDWNDPNQIVRFHRSCGVCPVVSTCRFAIPSAPYYLSGKLSRRRRSSPKPEKLEPALLSVRDDKLISLAPKTWNKKGSRSLAEKFLSGEIVREEKPVQQAHPEFKLKLGSHQRTLELKFEEDEK